MDARNGLPPTFSYEHSSMYRPVKLEAFLHCWSARSTHALCWKLPCALPRICLSNARRA
jgi:hypothetical protein